MAVGEDEGLELPKSGDGQNRKFPEEQWQDVVFGGYGIVMVN